MSYALGQPVLLSSLVRDSAGALANATTVTLNITLPDGTVTVPFVTNPPAVTGTYVYTYAPLQAGLHAVRWTFGGTNASAPIIDSFYVEASGVEPIVSLAEARQQCRLSSPADDPEVQFFSLIASEICEEYTQVWRRTTMTETFDGGKELLRLRTPVLSITSVTENGIAVTSTGWVLNTVRGWLHRGTTQAPQCWAYGQQNIACIYVVGSPSDIPHPVRQGVRLLIQHLWNSQRGGSGLPRQVGVDFTVDPRTGFTIPNAVLELWRPYRLPSVA